MYLCLFNFDMLWQDLFLFFLCFSLQVTRKESYVKMQLESENMIQLSWKRYYKHIGIILTRSTATVFKGKGETQHWTTLE